MHSARERSAATNVSDSRGYRSSENKIREVRHFNRILNRCRGNGRTVDIGSCWLTVIDLDQDFDQAATSGIGPIGARAHGAAATPYRGTPAGLIFNGSALRSRISAPPGESSGWLDFQVVADMLQNAGRPICSAMRELLGQTRLLSAPTEKRLPALLKNSRRYQNEVSEKLAEQVLHALYELLRGFQAAQDASEGELLRRWLTDDPDEIYRGLLTVVLRLVFLLYSEERDMLPQDATFLDAYSVSGLYDRLREDAAQYPDTMDQRYGAYAQLLALWRMVHDGAMGVGMRLSPRHGDLFHPDSYPFLEGRGAGARQVTERIEPPRVSDGTIHRVLEKLVVLDAERISYRALDVEHIGSVYETMMGFRLETATGRSVAIKAQKRHGAPTTVNIEELLQEAHAKRLKWLQDRTDRKLTSNAKRAVEEVDGRAVSAIDEMHIALDSVIDRNATPDLVPSGAMVLQPSEERRRSGSHYTPRELTEPIVRKALEPLLARLQSEAEGPRRPEQIFGLKVCDPAMGSGAFLVEACRQLADELIEAWRVHDSVPEIPPDDNETILARRLVAQRCLYGVDRNPKAVDLAKLSLWLTTLAKEHPLTFLDHALRHGDSLVGLSLPQLQAFHWKGDAPAFDVGFEALHGREHLSKATALRQQIREADDHVPDWERRRMLRVVEVETAGVRRLGDLVLAAFFEGSTLSEREAHRTRFANEVLDGNTTQYDSWLDDLRNAEPPLAPFHWEIEFPEVFDRDNPGFDTIVGNPPFLGGRDITAMQGSSYSNWLRTLHRGSGGGADLAAHFFRRSFDIIRLGGVVGLIATNTIAQGDSRASGLRWICKNGGRIYHAHRRKEWPGLATVIVSVVHIIKGKYSETRRLDGQEYDEITAFLFHSGGHDDPARLTRNSGKSFQGSIVLGMGFTFDDTDNKGIATSLAEMRRLIENDPGNQDVILPYIGGAEINKNPMHDHDRYVINFGERSESECKSRWPDLMSIVEERVRPERVTKDASKYPRMVHEWWKYWNPRVELYDEIGLLSQVLVVSRHSQHTAFAFVPTDMVYSDALIVFAVDTSSAFCALQSRIHETWTRFFGSSLEDRIRYTPTDCFETFPFPESWKACPELEAAGKDYYSFRAALMVRNDEGMTKTYNRFHDPYENDVDIVELRRLHAAMDRAVLDAYGWFNVSTECDFFLDYEIDEETWGTKKKPYRYRWPDDIRDEVLGRLLELNALYAAEEARAGHSNSTSTSSRQHSRGRPPRARSPGDSAASTLWGTVR